MQEKKLKERIDELLELVEQGDTNAMLELADMYEEGKGVKMDVVKAMELRKEAGY